MNSITTTIQNMINDESQAQARYFFSKAHSYQKLHLWLEPLFDDGFFSLNENNEFQYLTILEFLEKVSIQNKEDEKSKITKRLLSIANQTIEQATNDHIVWYMIKVIFNLQTENITLEHIDFINSHVRNCKYRSILNHDITKTVMPVLIENKMRKHMLKLLPLIFGYILKKDTLSHVEPISIIEEYNLQELLKRHSKDMIRLVGLDGLKIVVKLIKDITTQEKSIFNHVWLTVIRTKTENEIKQNRHSDRYDNQLIFFTRNLFEDLPPAEVKPYIEDFLLKQQHPIFVRLALHVVNCKYSDLKDVFWQWMDADIQYERKELELWTLLKESSKNFTNDEFNKIIDWIEISDCREYRPNDSNETIKLCNAYRRKEWLLCLKDNNERAKELYQKYHLINHAEVEHSGFSYWSSGFYRTKDLKNPIENLCGNKIKDIISKIKDFAPDLIEKKHFTTNNDLIDYVANDLSTCVKANPQKFSAEITNFHQLDYAYKRGLIQGFKNAWNDKQKFDWGKVLDFIFKELTPDFFIVNKKNKHYLISEITDLIKYGTPDENAFDKKHLPVAKNILLKLIENKEHENEDDITNNLGNHVLNSNNGKALHALIHYALRYGRLHSTKKVKWEKEIKDFFTQQLSKNDVYSKSVFTILGTYLSQLHFLDRAWVEKNFNKIFPLENKALWKASIKAYFFHADTVYKETYNLFKDNGHIKEILLTDFKESGAKSRIISFVCIAYINDIDNYTIFDIINSKNTDNILRIIRSMLQVYIDEKSKPKKDKIKTIWNNIYEIYKSDNSDDVQKIFSELCDWLVFLDEIANDDMELLKYTVKHAKGDYQAYNLVAEMARLSVNYAQEVSGIYKHMIDNDIYPIYKGEDVNKILGNLSDSDTLEITNCYLNKGIYNLIKPLD